MSATRTEIRTMNKGTAREFERVYLFCPNGHEVVSAPVDNATGRRLVALDFSREECGFGSCGWNGRNDA